MTILVVGASGATGNHVVRHLVEAGQHVRAVVRNADGLPQDLRNSKNLDTMVASLLDLDDTAMEKLVDGCDAIVSCLGHNLTFKGMYGQPRMLVTDAAKRLCTAVLSKKPSRPVKYILMNTTGNVNLDIPEKISLAQTFVVGLIRWLVPPHRDNENAANYLRTTYGQNHKQIEWVAVRPDTLIDAEQVSEYTLHPSPTRSAIFDAGKTSRINVAHFMATLAHDDKLWQTWKGQMPVVYNKE